MSVVEDLAVFERDKLFGGDWENDLAWIEANGSRERKKYDVKVIKRLRDFEMKHKVNLTTALPDSAQKIQLPESLLKAVLSPDSSEEDAMRELDAFLLKLEFEDD
jgi:hypothetical protein